MFARLSTLALLLPFAAAISINSISGWSVPGIVTISWSPASSDPASFSIELVNTAFIKEYAIGTNIPTSSGKYTFQLPQVLPGGDYSINLVSISDVNDVLASSNSFSISAASSTTGTDSSTGASSTATGSSSNSSGTSARATGTGTASGASSTPSNSSGAASAKLTGVAPAAAFVLSALAGAAMVF